MLRYLSEVQYLDSARDPPARAQSAAPAVTHRGKRLALPARTAALSRIARERAQQSSGPRRSWARTRCGLRTWNGCPQSRSVLRSCGGIDTDPEMVVEAQTAAAEQGINNTQFMMLQAEELPAGLGRFRTVTFAQCFHWVDQRRVAAAVFDLLEPGGVCAVIYGWTLRGDAVERSPHPLPPNEEMNALASLFRDSRPSVSVAPGDETNALASVDLEGPTAVTVPGGDVIKVSIDDLIARLLSRSGTTPDALGDAETEFRARAGTLLAAATGTGWFAERLRDTRVNLWTKPRGCQP
jgi:SAM-dependent methyltransferase